MKPKIAIIGLGVMGHRMLDNMASHGGFNLVSAWDPNAEACREVADTYAIAIADEPFSMIKDPATDMIYIASPPTAHLDYAIAAADAGKIIYCEKPLGTDVLKSRALVAHIEAAGVANAVNFSLASARAATYIGARLVDGTIGDVAGIDVRLHFTKWPRDWQATATWLAERAEGGFVREAFSHYAFLIERLFGAADLIDSSVLYPDDLRLCETHFFARLDCRGVPVSAACGSGGVGTDRVEFTVWGSKASYRLWDWNKLKSSTGDAWVDELTGVADPRLDGYRLTLDNVLEMANGRLHTMPDAAAALSVQELVENILAN
jgi:predicted dehydrogenase